MLCLVLDQYETRYVQQTKWTGQYNICVYINKERSFWVVHTNGDDTYTFTHCQPIRKSVWGNRGGPFVLFYANVNERHPLIVVVTLYIHLSIVRYYISQVYVLFYVRTCIHYKYNIIYYIYIYTYVYVIHHTCMEVKFLCQTDGQSRFIEYTYFKCVCVRVYVLYVCASVNQQRV